MFTKFQFFPIFTSGNVTLYQYRNTEKNSYFILLQNKKYKVTLTEKREKFFNYKLGQTGASVRLCVNIRVCTCSDRAISIGTNLVEKR